MFEVVIGTITRYLDATEIANYVTRLSRFPISIRCPRTGRIWTTERGQKTWRCVQKKRPTSWIQQLMDLTSREP